MTLEEMRQNEAQSRKIVVKYILYGLSFVGLVTLIGMWGCPQYSIYEQRLSGEAELAKATYNRQIKVKEAEAAKESATLLAQGEIERAKGVAEANRIIGRSLEGNESYLRYLWIHNLGEGKNETIYIPTEAGLPILEAGKRKHQTQ